MTQLKIWSREDFDKFIDTSQIINPIEKEPQSKKDFWELTSDDPAYWAIKDLEKKDALEKSRKDVKNKLSYIGFSERQAKTALKIVDRKNLATEIGISLDFFSEEYKEILDEHKKMLDDPVSFYQKNKKIRNLENNVLTFGSLSLSYSFCSPFKLIRTIIKDAEGVRGFHNYMIECSDENHKIEEFDNMLIKGMRDDELIENKTNSLIQDLRGNKVPKDLIGELISTIKYYDRDSDNEYFGSVVLTKKTLIDSLYVFFGSKLGSDFVGRWAEGEDKEQLKQEFENHIYTNPYVNLGLIDKSMKDFGSPKHIESAKHYLKHSKGKRYVEQDMGLKSKE